MTTPTNRYCEVLGIERPDLAKVKGHRDANTYSLLLVALLERGEGMTLDEVAERFEEAGVAPREAARKALSRCKPNRTPVVRDGETYELDPHDDELGLWVFRLGLRPPKVPFVRPTVEETKASVPPPTTPVTVAELEEAFRGQSLTALSQQRLAMAVLEAHGKAMTPEEVVAFIRGLSPHTWMTPDSKKFSAPSSPVRVEADGRWALAAGPEVLLGMRHVVRDRLVMVRKWASYRTPVAEAEERYRAWERQRAENALRIEAQSRVIVHGFPRSAPRAVVLVDTEELRLESFREDELETVRTRLEGYDVIAGLDVRAQLRGLGFDPGARRLADLGAPQKSLRTVPRGKTWKLTTELFVRASCGISRPFGDEATLRKNLDAGKWPAVLRRLEEDAKSLVAMHRYARLHHALRIRVGSVDDMIPCGWVESDAISVNGLLRAALARGAQVEFVAGKAPPWDEPWADARRGDVEPLGHWFSLFEEAGYSIDLRDLQALRIVGTVH